MQGVSQGNGFMNIDVNGDNNRVAGRDYIELRIYCLHCETANHAPLALIKRAITQLLRGIWR